MYYRSIYNSIKDIVPQSDLDLVLDCMYQNWEDIDYDKASTPEAREAMFDIMTYKRHLCDD